MRQDRKRLGIRPGHFVRLILSGVTASAYAAIFIGRRLSQKANNTDERGRAFNPSSAIAFAVTVSAILFASAAVGWVRQALWQRRVWRASRTPMPVAISAASLVAAGKITVADAVPKIIAVTKGGRQFALGVIPGLIWVLFAAWLGSVLRF